MKFTIEFGETEKHILDYHFSQLMGRLVVTINQQPVRKTVRHINEPVFEVEVFVVGKHEKHEVRIEKRRTSTFTHRNRVFVDDRLVKVVGNN